MRKILVLVCALALVLGICTPVLAANDTIKINDLGISLSLPSNYFVFTQETPANDPLWALFEIDYNETISYFKAEDIYLDAVSMDLGDEIMLTATREDMIDFNEIGDALLELFVTSMIAESAAEGVILSNQEVYQAARTKFVRLYIYDTNVKAYGMRYFTIYNGMALSFTMNTGESRPSQAQEKVMQDMVNSISFISQETQDQAAYLYTDSRSGATFTVPGGWLQQPEVQDEVEFIFAKDNESTIIYSSNDTWGSMTPAERNSITRAEFNNSLFSIEDMATIYGTTPDQISMVTYNGITYFKGIPQDLESDETGIALICVENGWLYGFAFTGSDSLTIYSDFERLMSTVTLPVVEEPVPEETQPEETVPPTESVASEPGETTPTDTTPAETTAPQASAAGNGAVTATTSGNDQGNSELRWIIIGASVTMSAVVAILVILLLARKKKRRTAPPPVYTPPVAPPVDPVPPAPPAQNSLRHTAVCTHCGSGLSSSDRFCPNCGTLRND